ARALYWRNESERRPGGAGGTLSPAHPSSVRDDMESKPRRNSLFLVVRSAFRPLHAGLLLLSLLMALDPPVRAVGLFGLAVYAILVCYDVWGSSRAWATAAEIEPEQIAEPYAGQLREAEAARRR